MKLPDPNVFVGQTLESVKEKVPEVRIVELDGECFMVTYDHIFSRLNVSVYAGVVTHAYWG